MESRSCKKCTYAFPINGSDWVECRRYPPIEATATRSGFPTSPVNGWCGEYQLHIIKVQITERA